MTWKGSGVTQLFPREPVQIAERQSGMRSGSGKMTELYPIGHYHLGRVTIIHSTIHVILNPG
jgi:hypothetical protein